MDWRGREEALEAGRDAGVKMNRIVAIRVTFSRIQRQQTAPAAVGGREGGRDVSIDRGRHPAKNG